MKTVTTLLKILSVVTGLVSYQGMIPEKYLPIALFVFAIASTLKDLVAKIGDYLDDHKMNGSFKPPLMLLLILPMVFAGCAHFVTKQTDTSYDEQGNPQRSVTTTAKATTFFDAGSALTSFKASQTDKSQSATVGSLNQSSSGSNAVNLVESAVSAAVSAAVKSVKP